MGGEICTDNRFEIIAAYKKKLIESTNIQSRPEEMAVIDDILFRFWQMGWLPPIPHGRLVDADAFTKDECNYCDGACEALPCDCLNCKSDCRCDFMKDIADAPTIIPAEPCNDLAKPNKAEGEDMNVSTREGKSDA